MKYILIIWTLSSTAVFGQVKQIVDSVIITILPVEFVNANHVSVRDLSLSRDGNEAFFTVQSADESVTRIASVKKINNKWEPAQLLSFNQEFNNLEPFIDSSGNRLYFVSNRPLKEGEKANKDFDIWYVERNANGSKDWSKPVNLGAPVNSANNEFYPTLSDNGNLYFTMDAQGGTGKDDIYFCKWNGKKFENPVLLPLEVNSTGMEFNAFISPDEHFILFTKYEAKDGFGSGDIYVSYKDKKDNWSAAKNLGIGINSKQMDYCPFYDVRTQTLYFTSKGKSNIEKVKSKKFKSIKEFDQWMNGAHNGMSKVYEVKVEL